MSNSDESFLSRWLTLRQQPGDLVPASIPPDLSTLPAIESLTSASDIAAFLKPGVPADLLRQALSRTWRADPGIRDFVGIAESQWDFNDPTAMPGFGVLEPMEHLQSVVKLSDPHAEPLVSPSAETPRDLNPGRDGQLDNVWLAAGQSNETISAPSAHEMSPPAADGGAAPPAGIRRHGSALPRPI